jgi:hypothetical protein
LPENRVARIRQSLGKCQVDIEQLYH